MAPRKIIIDTDPGIDDILALLFAFSASASELDIQLISVTHGNIGVQSCLRNVISLFHTIAQERKWRQDQGKPAGFDALFNAKQKPLVAVGADEPLEEQPILADYFHGPDGLGGIHASHPHLSPDEAWKTLFDVPPAHPPASDGIVPDQPNAPTPDALLFTPLKVPAHQAILDILASNPPGEVTIVAVGPLTNLALAAARDPGTFLRVREIVVMGGALGVPGNITPLAEFNTHADTIAAARLYALSSPTPSSTMPLPMATGTHIKYGQLGAYPDPLPGPPLRITLFPLDITDEHILYPASFAAAAGPLRDQGSPLAAWTSAFMKHAFNKSMEHGAQGLSVHDAVCVWYKMVGPETPGDSQGWNVIPDHDVRVETTGQWTRGACITDKRGRVRAEVDPASLINGERPGDRGSWCDVKRGNRLGVCVKTPGGREFEQSLLSRVFNHQDTK